MLYKHLISSIKKRKSWSVIIALKQVNQIIANKEKF